LGTQQQAVRNVSVWLDGLRERLRGPYTPPLIRGGHEFLHVDRLVHASFAIRKHLQFDIHEFEAAALLHNLDRAMSFRDRIEAFGREWAKMNQAYFETIICDELDIRAFVRIRGLELLCREMLFDGPFDQDAIDRIVDVVMKHNKKDDDLMDDSPLLAALRIADKLDRFGALGVVASASFRGGELMAYDPDHPFGYDSTAEGKLKSCYNDLFRVLEWYGMLPYDWARELIPIRNLRFFILFIRQLGEEIAEATGKPNEVEADIAKALGPFYKTVATF